MCNTCNDRSQRHLSADNNQFMLSENVATLQYLPVMLCTSLLQEEGLLVRTSVGGGAGGVIVN